MSQNPAAKGQQNQQPANNFYFQLHLKSISSKGNKQQLSSALAFTISKGKQVFDHTKPVPVEWNQDINYELSNQRLNFVVLNYNPQKYEQFAFRVCRPESLEQDHLAEYMVDCNNFIDHFVKTKNGAFDFTMNCEDKFVVEAQLFVERNRISIEKMIREIHNQKQGSGGSKIEPQRIDQRSQEVKSKLLRAPRQNRFKRTPSPLRRQVKDILVRRQSPRRKTPHSKNKSVTPEKPQHIQHHEPQPQHHQKKIIEEAKPEVEEGVDDELKKVRFKGVLSEKQENQKEGVVIQKTESTIQNGQESPSFKPGYSASLFFFFVLIAFGLYGYLASGPKKKAKTVKIIKQTKIIESQEDKPKPANSKKQKSKAAKKSKK